MSPQVQIQSCSNFCPGCGVDTTIFSHDDHCSHSNSWILFYNNNKKKLCQCPPPSFFLLYIKEKEKKKEFYDTPSLPTYSPSLSRVKATIDFNKKTPPIIVPYSWHFVYFFFSFQEKKLYRLYFYYIIFILYLKKTSWITIHPIFLFYFTLPFNKPTILNQFIYFTCICVWFLFINKEYLNRYLYVTWAGYV
jgi:hypothetical protein